jgi:hypothetical protein
MSKDIDDMTREEVQAELERRGIDVSKQAERVLAAVRRARTCDRCGLPGKLLNLVGGNLCHAEPGDCIAALKAEIERLRAIVDIICRSAVYEGQVSQICTQDNPLPPPIHVWKIDLDGRLCSLREAAEKLVQFERRVSK